MGGQALVLDVEGTWRELTGVVNKLAANLTNQVRSIAKVTKAVALGDLSKQIEVDARGEILELKNTVNTMVDQLNSFASEVTRVAKEVGSDGKLGGQAEVQGVSGTWKDLTDNVNFMASNLTSQVRNIALVTDGRYSGASHGFIVGHVTPEAARGGPIALVRDGDAVLIDAVENRIDVLNATVEELRERTKSWRPPVQKPLRGTLAKYARLVGDASHGAVTDSAEPVYSAEW